MKIYLVGGAVRDQLLGLPIKERDWVVVGSDVTTLLSEGYQQVGRDFPVFLHPDTREEYALARTEKKRGVGYHGFECDTSTHVTLEEDLARRDLTVNAIAQDDAGQLIDPYHGQRDIERKVLRHVSDAFVEDPVRVLRVARFMARFQRLGFTVAPETRILMQDMVRSGELTHLVAERVWQEWQQSLSEDNPESFITTLRECGALRVVLPEVDALFGAPNSRQYHPEVDSGIHTLMVLQVAVSLSSDPVVRFAAVLHDLGKACTPMQTWPGQHDHDALGIPVVQDLCQRLAIPKRYQKLAMIAAQWHLYIHRVSELSAEKIVDVLERCQAFRNADLFEQLLVVCEADSRGRGGAPRLNYSQAQKWRALLLACGKITAQTAIKEGLKGAEIKKALFDARVACIDKGMK
ncbi:MAG: multifunctional CCA addition/repair protein [Gammaproteobacteria bacterium]|nr:multifunctional CCA addition/repair protein [Gammaproteobacteria bacterium]